MELAQTVKVAIVLIGFFLLWCFLAGGHGRPTKP